FHHTHYSVALLDDLADIGETILMHLPSDTFHKVLVADIGGAHIPPDRLTVRIQGRSLALDPAADRVIVETDKGQQTMDQYENEAGQRRCYKRGGADYDAAEDGAEH